MSSVANRDPSAGEDAAARLTHWLERTGRAVERVVETHLSVVAFTDDSVFKMKKPVRFSFCDLSTPDLRALDARREVELNSRLAPDVYRGVAAVTDAAGSIVDTAVEMRRLDDSARLSSIAAEGRGLDCVLAVARRIGAFHREAERSHEATAAATRDAFAALWFTGFEQWQRFRGDPLPDDVVERIEHLARRFLTGREALFDARVRGGRAIDGHGDLLADDIFCEPGGPRIIDCLEFDTGLRVGDALLDIAFLAMDLEAIGRRDLAAALMSEYRSATGDDWPPNLEHHYVAYRAHVRAKVACLRYEQGDDPSRALAVDRVRRCLDHLERGRVRMVLVGGLPGTGKSTIAAGLARQRDLSLLRSDEVRKETASGAGDPGAGEEYGAGIYAEERKRAIYEALLGRAAALLAGGNSVVVDATWNLAERRAAAQRVATATTADVVELVCDAPAPLCRQRLLQRLLDGNDPSDASPAIYDEMQRQFDAWPSATPLDTSRSAGETLSGALAAFDG